MKSATMSSKRNRCASLSSPCDTKTSQNEANETRQLVFVSATSLLCLSQAWLCFGTNDPWTCVGVPKEKRHNGKKRSFSLVRLKTHGMIYNMALLLLLLLLVSLSLSLPYRLVHRVQPCLQRIQLSVCNRWRRWRYRGSRCCRRLGQGLGVVLFDHREQALRGGVRPFLCTHIYTFVCVPYAQYAKERSWFGFEFSIFLFACVVRLGKS